MGAPTSSYATAGIALRVSGALKPHHYDKVETPVTYCIINYIQQAEVLRSPHIINFSRMMKLKNLKYNHVNKINIEFNDISKAIN
jgi:hypothetical protein